MNQTEANDNDIEIKIRLEIDFALWGSKMQDEFVNDLASIVDCPSEEILVLSVEKGCVIVRLKLPQKFARALLKKYIKSRDCSDIEPELEAFLEKYSIDQLIEQQHFETFMTIKKPASGKALLFIHGWSGGAESFGTMPQTLSAACGCVPYIYKYPSGLLKHSPSLAFVASDLANWIKNHIGNRRLAILCHSMGGLLTRRFILNESQSKKSRLDLNVKQVNFFASPHTGVSYASIGKRIIGLRSDQMQELDPNSPLLFQLNTEWPRWVADHVPSDCRLNSVIGTDDSVVSSAGGIGLSEETVALNGKDHINIIKPQFPRDDVNLTVWRFLSEIDFPEMEIPQSPKVEEEHESGSEGD